MRFTAAVAAATLAGVATASVAPKNGTGPAYVTEVVTAYTTYCPEPTEITHAGETYTVSEATTLTITNCPGGKSTCLRSKQSRADHMNEHQLTSLPRLHRHQARHLFRRLRLPRLRDLCSRRSRRSLLRPGRGAHRGCPRP